MEVSKFGEGVRLRFEMMKQLATMSFLAIGGVLTLFASILEAAPRQYILLTLGLFAFAGVMALQTQSSLISATELGRPDRLWRAKVLGAFVLAAMGVATGVFAFAVFVSTGSAS